MDLNYTDLEADRCTDPNFRLFFEWFVEEWFEKRRWKEEERESRARYLRDREVLATLNDDEKARYHPRW